MPIELYASASFNRSVRKLGAEQCEVVAQILEALKTYYASGCNLQEAQRKSPRFFYKQLRKPYYEAGVESNLRVIIAREKQICTALLAYHRYRFQKWRVQTLTRAASSIWA